MIYGQPITLGGGGKLPKGYTQLEYIESTGTQYIDTGFTPNQDTRVVVDFEWTAFTADFGGVFGARTSNSKAFALFYGTNFMYDQYGDTSDNKGPNVVTGRHTIDKNKNVTTIEDVYSKTFTYTAFTAECSLCLFTCNEPSAPSYYACGRVYSCQVYDNGTLIRDYVPCADENWTYGMYDLVNKVFYTNAGTGEFNEAVSFAPVLLWTNASPTSSFAAQTVNVAEHPTYLILWKVTSYTGSSTVTNQNVYLWSYLNADMNGICIYYPYYNTITNYLAGRAASYSGGAITFTGGMGVNSPNYYFIPVKIYGCDFDIHR